MKKKLFACLLAAMLVAVLVFVAAPSTHAAGDSLLTATADVKSFNITENGKTLDLNGQQGVTVDIAAGITLSVIDTANMELDGSTAGTLTVTGSGTIAHISRDDNYRYLKVENADGSFSFHPFNLMFTRIGINTLAGENDDQVEVCVQIAFIANNFVREKLGDYGICSVATGLETPANERYPFDNKNGVRAYFDLTDSLTKGNIDSTANYKAYMYVDGEKIESAYTLEVTPREILKTINSKSLKPTASQLERINALMAENDRVANILTTISGKTCAHHGGIAPYKEQATCIDCDSKYGELGIPEGAVMVTDFGSKSTTHTLVAGYGTTSAATDNWHAAFNGAVGVQSFGMTSGSGGWNYLEWENILPTDFNYSNYTHITFRIYVTSGTRLLSLCDAYANGSRVNEYDLLSKVTVGQWCYVTIPIADLKAFDLYLCNNQWKFGDLVYIDQAYVTLEEVAIPEGATLVTDFSEKGNHTLVNYSSYANATETWYEEYAGAAGVQGFGTTTISGGYSFIKWRDILPTNFDYSKYTHITFRVYFTSSVREVKLATFPDGDPYAAATNVYTLYNEGMATGQWHYITVPLNQLKDFDLLLGNKQWNYGDIVLFDQAYVTREEVAIPDGATLITDFGKTVAPGVNPNNYGGNSGAVAGYYSSYEEFDGRLGVFAMGANIKCYMWYYNVDLENVDLTRYETITFRLKTKSNLQTLDLVFDAAKSMPLIDKITKGEWTEVTINVADIAALGVANMASVDFSFKFYASESSPCEYVWFDQVFGQ